MAVKKGACHQTVIAKVIKLVMMTSSYGNIFRVTDHLPGEFPAQRPVTQTFDVFLWSAPE